MSSTFHEGELAVQERAGVRHQAQKIGSGIHGEIPPGAHGFLLAQRLAVIAAPAPGGAVWASLLAGPRGFLEPLDARRLRVHAFPVAGDPLEGLEDGADLGLLVIDLAQRKRLRLNGRAERLGDGFDVVTRQVFGNCPKYIQSRVPEELEAVDEAGEARRAKALDRSQREWIAGADTFFIATRHPHAGADASHRGGHPGFVEVVEGDRLAWPDYSGNRMFQTLGNLESDPRAGLLFLDFERGGTLQVTGRAAVDWDPARAKRYSGAERLVEFAIEETVEIRGRTALRFRLLARSPFNPA